MFLDKLLGFFTTRKLEVKQYADVLLDAYSQKKTANASLTTALEFAKKNNMNDSEIKEGQEKFAEELEFHLMTVEDMTEREMEETGDLINSLSLGSNKKNKLLKMALDRYLILQALNGTPHEFNKEKMPLPIVYKNGEKLYYLHAAINVKKQKKTVGVNFSGPVMSFRICKGLRYRVGSMNVSRETVESYDMSDQGMFYITNMRIGFLGKTQFSFGLNKLVSIQNGDAGLLFYKEGRQNPFMISFDDYDVPCTILSCLLNQ